MGSTALRTVLQPRPLARVPDVELDHEAPSSASTDWFADAPIGFALLDHHQRFRAVNDKLAELTGIDREDHVGHTARELLPGLPRLLEAIDSVLSSGEAMRSVEITGRTRATPDRPRHLLANLFPVREQRGVSVRVFVEDVSSMRELEHRNELLQQRTHNAAVIRERIVSIVAQDVRAPLSTILSCVEQVSRKFPIADRWRQTRVLLDTIRRSVERVNGLASELHDLAVLQSGRIEVQPAPHDVFSLVSQAMRVLEPLAGDRSLRLESDVATGVHVGCDRERIHQVLSALVRHAIERTPSGFTVTLRVELDRDVVRFLVREGGTMADDAASDAVPAFEHAWCPEGLSRQIAREIVRAHGGEIGVQSQLGAGDVTFFTLPCVPR